MKMGSSSKGLTGIRFTIQKCFSHFFNERSRHAQGLTVETGLGTYFSWTRCNHKLKMCFCRDTISCTISRVIWIRREQPNPQLMPSFMCYNALKSTGIYGDIYLQFLTGIYGDIYLQLLNFITRRSKMRTNCWIKYVCLIQTLMHHPKLQGFYGA